MVSMSILLSSLLLVSAVLAAPSSLAEASFARGHEDPQSPPINHVASRADAASYALMRAGAVLPQNNDKFFFVSGTIVVPPIPTTFKCNRSLSIYVFIDGYTYDRPALLLGISTNMYRPRGYKFQFFYWWYPHPRRIFISPRDSFPIATNQEIVATIMLLSPTEAKLQLSDKNCPSSNTTIFTNSTMPLYMQDAGWFLGPAAEDDGLPNFGKVVIKDAIAGDIHRTPYFPGNATILNIRRSDAIFTSVDVYGEPRPSSGQDFEIKRENNLTY